MIPSFNHITDDGFRLRVYQGYERDIIILDAVVSPNMMNRVKLDRETRDWLRQWFDHMDEEAQRDQEEV